MSSCRYLSLKISFDVREIIKRAKNNTIKHIKQINSKCRKLNLQCKEYLIQVFANSMIAYASTTLMVAESLEYGKLTLGKERHTER